MAGSRLSVEERIRIESWIAAGVAQVEMANHRTEAENGTEIQRAPLLPGRRLGA